MLSSHLTWPELACKDGTEYPVKWRENRALELAHAFEQVRALYGLPIIVLSAYRSESHNRAIGGARYSQHVQGRALDLRPPNGITVKRFYRDICKLIDTGTTNIKGIGLYKTFVHIDVRPSDRLVVWNGSGKKDS